MNSQTLNSAAVSGIKGGRPMKGFIDELKKYGFGNPGLVGDLPELVQIRLLLMFKCLNTKTI